LCESCAKKLCKSSAKVVQKLCILVDTKQIQVQFTYPCKTFVENFDTRELLLTHVRKHPRSTDPIKAKKQAKTSIEAFQFVSSFTGFIDITNEKSTRVIFFQTRQVLQVPDELGLLYIIKILRTTRRTRIWSPFYVNMNWGPTESGGNSYSIK